MTTPHPPRPVDQRSPASPAGPGPTFLGPSTAAAHALAGSLAPARRLDAPVPTGADHGWAWDGPPFDALDAWRAAIDDLPPADAIVVCTWPEPTAPRPLAELGPEAWRAAFEWPTACWFTTLVAAADRCADGGALVAVVERPATLDAVGHAASAAVADGVLNLVRSLAAAHGPRGVRINAVASAAPEPPHPMLGPPPPLATFPGRPDVEVAGAVRLLLSPDAVGVTGTVLDAGCGR